MKLLTLHVAVPPEGEPVFRFEPPALAAQGWRYDRRPVLVPDDAKVIPNDRHGQVLRWRLKGTGHRHSSAAQVLGYAAIGRAGFAMPECG